MLIGNRRVYLDAHLVPDVEKTITNDHRRKQANEVFGNQIRLHISLFGNSFDSLRKDSVDKVDEKGKVKVSERTSTPPPPKIRVRALSFNSLIL